MSDDGLLFLVGAGLVIAGAYYFLGVGAVSGDGGDETNPVSTGSGGPLDADSVFNLAQATLADMGIEDITPQMVTAIASIESSFDPSATRQEPRIGDASYGLMQVLGGTATWLVTMGYTAQDPSPANLLTPQGSIYFGCAYLHYLRNFHGQVQSDAFVVAAYNGGPGGASGAGPQNYLATYETRLSQLGFA